MLMADGQFLPNAPLFKWRILMANENVFDPLAKSAKTVGALTAETFHDTTAAARKSANGLGTLASAIASDTSNGAHQLGEAFKTESSKAMNVLRTTIQERPNLTVGIAAGIGVAIGLALSSRR
jgi:ElaB/YqjD/DUF883 family membrane-anchored ribosome-binding protein